MRIDLAGYGPGSSDLTTQQVWQALEEAELVITSERLAGLLWGSRQTDPVRSAQEAGNGEAEEVLSEAQRQEEKVSHWNILREEDRICLAGGAHFLIETRSAEICRILEHTEYDKVVCLFGGDSSFYSGAAPLQACIAQSAVLREKKAQIRILPGISSLSYACSRLGLSFHQVEVFSAHGRNCDPVRAVMNGKKSFFLTGGSSTPAKLCEQLTGAGLGELKVTVLENLSTSEERVISMTAAQAAGKAFAPLSVMIADVPFLSEQLRRGVPGILDEDFVRGEVPMTKRLVRVSALSLLNPDPGDLCWDLGAGSGSVSIELSARCRGVISVERDPAAIALLEENRKRFGAWNMKIVRGKIPDILEELPAPDRIFLGGGGRWIRAVLDSVRQRHCEKGKLPAVLATAITLETLQEVRSALEEYGYGTSTVQLAVTDIRKHGQFHMMNAQNPVFLILGTAKTAP